MTDNTKTNNSRNGMAYSQCCAKCLRHGSLFSGLGGFDLAAQWHGWENVFQVEIDEYCQRLLRLRFPKTDKHKDIRQFDGTKYAGSIDVISGGFPCQPFSHAGKRRGKEDDRDLWPEMFRVIQEIKPAWVVGENVAGFINMELDRSVSDLESAGYEVEAVIIPACAKNAPHRRDRVWIVGHSEKNASNKVRKIQKRSCSESGRNDCYNESGIITNSDSRGLQEPWSELKTDRLGQYDEAIANAKSWQSRQSSEWQRGEDSCGGDTETTTDTSPIYVERCERGSRQEQSGGSYQWTKNWLEVATELCGVDDGLPAELDGFKLSKSRHRIERLKALGNAIVPQVAYQIFNSINDAEKHFAQQAVSALRDIADIRTYRQMMI